MLSALVHGWPGVHEKLGMYAHATRNRKLVSVAGKEVYLRREAIRLPTGQKTESNVNRFPEV